MKDGSEPPKKRKKSKPKNKLAQAPPVDGAGPAAATPAPVLETPIVAKANLKRKGGWQDRAKTSADASSDLLAVPADAGPILPQQTVPHSLKRRKRTRAAADLDSLPEDERRSRQRQRELQNSARAMQAAGKTYKKQQAPLQSKGAPASASRSKDKLQVVIIPIYWKKREAEAQQVLSLAGSVMQLLRQHSITASIDSSEGRTPGQKYRLWEERRVRARVEIGPKDAAAQQCVLAEAAASPGQLAVKQTFRVGPGLVTAAQKILGLEGAEEVADEQAKKANAPAAQHKITKQASGHAGEQQPKPSAASASESVSKVNHAPAAEALAHAESKQQQHKQQQQAVRKLAGGDDLGGDFADVDLLRDVVDEDSHRKSKKRKLKQGAQAEPGVKQNFVKAEAAAAQPRLVAF